MNLLPAFDTGYVAADAEIDFRRMRRRGAWSRWTSRLARACGGTGLAAFADVTAGLGTTVRRDLGRQPVALDTVVGSVGRAGDFDRWFHPGRSVDGRRWAALDRAMRSGENPPPIDLYRVGDRHYVVDGHHRVSVARALGWTTLDAHVIEVRGTTTI